MLDNIFLGRAEPLGACIYKLRVARQGEGKRGGFRNIFYWKKGKLVIFCLLYPKNIRENITQETKRSLRILSDEYSLLSKEEIEKRIKNKDFEVIHYEK